MKNPVTIENGIAFITLPTGQTTMIDETDLDLVSARSWSALPAGKKTYARVTVKKAGRSKSLLMHRLIMDPPEGFQIDHRDGDGLNNRRSNLRICTASENRCNQGKLGGNHSSQFKGVSWNREKKRWQALLAYEGRREFLGYFTNEYDAAQAYNFAASTLHSAFACPNTIPQPWLGPWRVRSKATR